MKRQTLVALVLVTILLASLVGFAVAQGPDRRGGHKLPVAPETPATEEPAEAEAVAAWEPDLGVVEGPGLRAGAYSFVGGGLGNKANGAYSFVGGGRKNKADGDYSSVVGGYNSWARSKYATIGGGQHNTAKGWRSTVSGGRDNETRAEYATVGGGRENKANKGYTTVGGGYKNVASGEHSIVGGGDWNTASGWSATVGGGSNNTASGSRATVGGGLGNTASGWEDTVGGGGGNTASGEHATVPGGYENTASGEYATVGGGGSNTASNYAATISGGRFNATTDWYATVGGGHTNTASGHSAVVPGGSVNTAAGDNSFAGGYRAKANHQGSFIWADSTNADFMSERVDQFRVRAWGGAHFGDGVAWWVELNWTHPISTSTGAYLSAGGNWTNSSDRALKENFSAIESQDVLRKLADMPISTWDYRAKEADPAKAKELGLDSNWAEVRHMGPTSQDFYAAFGLGDDDQHISTLDADGVALAAIQGLYRLVQEQAARIEALEARLAALERAAP